MDVSEKWGTDVDTAVDLALAELKLTREQVDITVLEEPSRGFFGIGSKLALVRVEKKKESIDEKNEEKIEKKKSSSNKEIQKTAVAEKKNKDQSHEPVKDKEHLDEDTTLTSHSLINQDLGELEPCTDHPAIDFLKEVTEKMGLSLDICAKSNENNVYVEIEGKDSGTIIGKRGQTLDAIQYLTSLVVNKGKHDYIRVVVDAENYRSKREKTLEQLAVRLAGKAVRTQKSVKLEPMNPYERKVIHATLQSDSRVVTRSEGQDPYRRVIIELK